MNTPFTSLVGCELPVQLAGMGDVGSAELSAAVISAGACGMVPGATHPPDGASGVNYLMPFLPDIAVIEDTARRARVVDFFYADPRRDLVDVVHRQGALAGWQVGSAAEATAAVEAGCDYVVAQGIEAGGHVRGTQPLDVVLATVRAAVRVPVLAAGGIATAERVSDLMRAGAAAVRVGTRFVASPESNAHPDYVRSLVEATSGGDTMVTEWFNRGWPDAPHRVLKRAYDAAQGTGWRRPSCPTRDRTEDVSGWAMYAGTGVGGVTGAQAAADVVADLVRLL